MPRKSKPTKVLIQFAEYTDNHREADENVSNFLEDKWEAFKATLPEPKKREPVDATSKILKIIQKNADELDLDVIQSELDGLSRKPVKRRKTE